MRFIAKAQESREQDVNMMMRGFVKIQTAKVLCLRLQCLERIRVGVLKFTTGTEGKVDRMSDDLISRKALLGTECLLMTDIVENNPTAKYILEQVLYDIDHAETAFDKEKVIEKLKRLEKDTFDYYNRYNDEMAFGESAAFRSAIEIVEKGGVE